MLIDTLRQMDTLRSDLASIKIDFLLASQPIVNRVFEDMLVAQSQHKNLRHYESYPYTAINDKHCCPDREYFLRIDTDAVDVMTKEGVECLYYPVEVINKYSYTIANSIVFVAVDPEQQSMLNDIVTKQHIKCGVTTQDIQNHLMV